jgi:hypothetical protein
MDASERMGNEENVFLPIELVHHVLVIAMKARGAIVFEHCFKMPGDARADEVETACRGAVAVDVDDIHISPWVFDAVRLSN